MLFRLRPDWGCGMDFRRLSPVGLVLFLSATICVTCDNDTLDEASALQVFGSKESAVDRYSPAVDRYSPAEDGYSPTEDGYSARGDTWTDSSSGLTWQVEPTGGTMHWSEAKAHCSGPSLDGGGWHLPTIGELRTLIRGCPATEDDGSCNLEEGKCLEWSCEDNSCDVGCGGGDGPADGVYWPDEMQGLSGWYWSSSAVEDSVSDNYRWNVAFSSGRIDFYDLTYSARVRCVR